MTVSEYECNRYARECVLSEAAMCQRFEDGLNEDVKLLVGILEINEFVVLVERACKAKEKIEKLSSNLKISERDLRLATKKFKNDGNRSKPNTGISTRERPPVSSRATSVASIGNVRSSKPECQQCDRRHFRDCWGKSINRTCYRCSSQDHFIRDCPETVEKGTVQSARPSGTTTRGRPSRVGGGRSGTQRGTKMRLFDQRPAYRLEPMPSVLERRLHLQTSLPTLPVESTEFVIRVSKPLGRCVLVDKVCKNCPLMIRDVFSG
ncbi:reverse transcriptase [Gossypium australe]|uniref:Reverse transcriptase n=1 Tax=Gossypium australe TaxID=47621 RepID=A0A5B6VN50_9ROSI|nr:reverse transcriptase [Gossypium australe]